MKGKGRKIGTHPLSDLESSSGNATSLKSSVKEKVSNEGEGSIKNCDSGKEG